MADFFFVGAIAVPVIKPDGFTLSPIYVGNRGRNIDASLSVDGVWKKSLSVKTWPMPPAEADTLWNALLGIGPFTISGPAIPGNATYTMQVVELRMPYDQATDSSQGQDWDKVLEFTLEEV